MPRPSARSLLALIACTAVTGCATNLSGPGIPTTSASSSLPAITASQKLAAELPASVRASGQLVVGTSPTYPPMDGLEGGQVVGLDMDLISAVAQRLGLTVVYKQAPFDQILIGLTAQKYDIGVSSFTVNKEREASYTMISYMSAGSQWAVQKGNPAKVVVEKPCGLTIAVQSGTVEETEMKQKQASCGSKPLKLLSFEDQGDATSALITGRAQVMAADSPIALYAVKMNSSSIEALGATYQSAPYGFVVRQNEGALATAVKDALTDLKDSGHYAEILDRWNAGTGAISTFEVNP